ncbi:MAG: hypothetical protein FJ267_02710 [Planctomycetes bacterium]|nr:hypothetical protein [Planctomycetota bacterium]
MTFRSIFLIVVSFFLETSSWGQTLIPSAPNESQVADQNIGELLPSPETPSPAPLPPASSNSGHRGPCDPDYWIVSSRCCAEKIVNCQACDYQVFHADGTECPQQTLDDLYASLQPGVPVCFMVHGSYVVWDSMLQDCAGTYRWLKESAPDRPLHIVFFTWPSDMSQRILHVNHLGRMAELNSVYLAELVARVPDCHPISLIGHSHGARMVSATSHLLAGGQIQGRNCLSCTDCRNRIRIVLAAAALDHDWYNPGGRFELALCRCEAALNLRNRHDLPLQIYPARRLFASRALGHSGITRSDRKQLGGNGCRIGDYDVTETVGLGHIWAHYYCQPSLACVIRHYIYFDD